MPSDILGNLFGNSGDQGGGVNPWSGQANMPSPSSVADPWSGMPAGTPAGAVFQMPNPDGTVTYYDASGNPVGTGPDPYSGGSSSTTSGIGSPGTTSGDTTGIDTTGGSGSGLDSVLRALGLGGGAAGLAGLAGIVAPLLGGLYSAHKTNQATQQVLGGINNANTAIKGLLGGPSAYAPFAQAGVGALSKLNGMNFTPMNFAPLGTPGAFSPSGLTLGNLASSGKKG